ncbi:MAG TPA: ABC transporter permease [Thermoleophilaceae bacterium]|nr:ABC transporter permease [Thermoleophilaceae bacterium]
MAAGAGALPQPRRAPRRRRGGGRGRQSYLTPRAPIPRWMRTALAFGGGLTVIALWSALSYGGVYDEFFLPTPTTVASAWWDMITKQGFASDIGASAGRIGLGFLLAAVIAVPLGIAIGSFRVVQSYFEPTLAAIRYMPASAFIPLLILWLGIGEQEKVAVIFLGVFFSLTLLIADVSANVPQSLLNISYTLGASRRKVFTRVLLPACWPGVLDNLRIGMGWAWTYLIVAELVAASSGIGHVILASSRTLSTDQVIAGILTIGALGLITDGLFRWAYRMLFPYAERTAR